MSPAEPSQEGRRALTWTGKVEVVGGFLAAMPLQHGAEGKGRAAEGVLHLWRHLGRWMTSVPYLSACML